jgi:two-component system, NarL family, sensor histidine kinase UhpB
LAKRQKNANSHIDETIRDPEVFINNLRDEAPYPLFVINPDLSIGYVNPAFEKLTGFTLDELIGVKPPYPWWIGDSESKTQDLKNKVLIGGTIERCNVKKNGERFWVQTTGKPVYIDGKLKYFLSNWVDITERRESEKRQKKLNRELRELSAHQDSIREEERGNISRLIHDEIGQSLTALKMNICWMKKRLYPDQHLLVELSDSMISLIDSAIHKARWISTSIRPIWLDDLGLMETLKWLVEEFQEMTGIKCTFKYSQNVKPDKPTSIAIYRIFQEVLTNVFRHSHANQVDISLKKWGKKIKLQISDNGIGISKDKVNSNRSYGIIGIRERIHFLGGTFKISGKKNKGTFVSVTLPIQSEKG